MRDAFARDLWLAGGAAILWRFTSGPSALDCAMVPYECVYIKSNIRPRQARRLLAPEAAI